MLPGTVDNISIDVRKISAHVKICSDSKARLTCMWQLLRSKIPYSNNNKCLYTCGSCSNVIYLILTGKISPVYFRN